MTKENKDLLMKLLQQHKVLGISDQIDSDKFIWIQSCLILFLLLMMIMVRLSTNQKWGIGL